MLGFQYNKPHHHHPQTSTSVVEPYNSVLTTHSAMEFSDVTFLVDNDAVFSICKDKLEVKLFLFIVDNVLLAGSDGFLQRTEPTDRTSERKLIYVSSYSLLLRRSFCL